MFHCILTYCLLILCSVEYIKIQYISAFLIAVSAGEKGHLSVPASNSVAAASKEDTILPLKVNVSADLVDSKL